MTFLEARNLGCVLHSSQRLKRFTRRQKREGLEYERREKLYKRRRGSVEEAGGGCKRKIVKPQTPSPPWACTTEPRGTPCKISHKDHRLCTIMAPGLLVLSPVFLVTSTTTVMTRHSLRCCSLPCTPRVNHAYTCLLGLPSASSCAYSRDNGAGTTKPQGCAM